MIELGWREWAVLPDLGLPRMRAKIDTGARTSALHVDASWRFAEGGAPWVGFRVRCGKRRVRMVEAAAPRTVDVGAAAGRLVGNVDVIYTSTDNNVVSAYEALVKVGMDAKIPLVAADTDSVARGAVAAYGMDYKAIGVQTGQMVVRILKGEKPGDIASETSKTLELHVNPGAAQKQGITLSDALVKDAAKVVQ